MFFVFKGLNPARANRNENRILIGSKDRMRVDGKYLARGRQRLRLRGITYGPFAPNDQDEPFPVPEQVGLDFELMIAAGINSIRTYHLPPDWLLHLADERGLAVFLDVPWPKHLCFLDSAGAQRQAREAIRQAAKRGQ